MLGWVWLKRRAATQFFFFMRAPAVVAEASAKESNPQVFQLPFFLTVYLLPKLVLFITFVFEVRFSFGMILPAVQ